MRYSFYQGRMVVRIWKEELPFQSTTVNLDVKKENTYSDAARQFGKNSKASTTKITPAACGRNSSSLGRRREWPGTSTR